MRSALFILSIGLLTGSVARAEEQRQLPFTAIVGPAGSISVEGQTERVVYLSWGPASGELPPGLTTFEIYRDEVLIAVLDARLDATPAEIQSLYAGPEHARRRLELARRLCHASAGVSVAPDAVPDCRGPALAPFLSALGERLHEQLVRVRSDLAARRKDHPESHVFVASLTRFDHNVAISRRLGFRDIPTTTGQPVRYRLEARGDFYGTPVNATVGEVLVTPDAPLPVPGAGELRQVPDVERGARCDTPSLGQVHGTVALSWRHGGVDSPTSRFYADQLIVGYDLYRSRHALTPAALEANPSPCELDLTALASTRPFDPVTGHIELPGLVRLSDAPILIVPGPGDPSLHIDDRPTLAKAGLVPGDRLCYHVVPRDITGNWGETRSLLATVVDALPAPAPWDVEVLTRSEAEYANAPAAPALPQLETADHFALRWTHIDVQSYLVDFDDGRVFCNLGTAQEERRLRVARSVEACQTDFHEVSLDVIGYRVYRFDSVREAEAFRDTDGDGFADAIERAAVPPTDPCDANSMPVAGQLTEDQALITRHLWVPAPEPGPPDWGPREDPVLPLPDGRRTVVFDDAELASQPGERFYYRVVPVGSSGLAGEPSPPIAAFFPDKRMPPPPTLTLGTVSCEKTASAWESWGEAFAYDYTCEADRARILCVEDEAATCLEAWRGPFEGVVPACRSLRGVEPDLAALIARVAERGEEPTAEERSEAMAILLGRIAGATLWEAPITGTCGLMTDFGVIPRSASISVFDCQRAVFARYVQGNCRLAVQYVDRRGQPIAVHWDPEAGAPTPWIPIVDNPYLVRFGDDEPEPTEEGGCYFSTDLYDSRLCRLVPVEDGQVTDEDLVLTATVEPGACIDLNEEVQRPAEPDERDPTIAGPQFRSELFRKDFICDEDRTGLISVTIPKANNADASACYKASQRGSNNIVSPLAVAPCVRQVPAALPPPPPRLDAFTLASDGAMTLTWSKPAAVIGGIVVEWSRDDGVGYGTAFLFGALATGTASEVLEHPENAPTPAAGELWCVRAQAVAGGAGGALLSAWTPKRCAAVPLATPGLLDSIPWPEPSVPLAGPPLTSTYVPFDESFLVTLAKVDPDLYRTGPGGHLSCTNAEGDASWCLPRGVDCNRESSPGRAFCEWPSCTCGDEACRIPCTEPLRFHGQGLCLVATHLKRQVGDFVVYRQERRPDGQLGPFVQVSALVDDPRCFPIEVCLELGPTGCLASTIEGYILADQELALVRMSPSDIGASDLVFVDRFPHVGDPNHAYRHELVFFDTRGEIVGRRMTGWVSAGGSP